MVVRPSSAGARPTILSRAQRFAADTTGASAVQYALVVALIVCGGLVMASSSQIVARQFSQVTDRGLTAPAPGSQPKLAGQAGEKTRSNGDDGVASNRSFRTMWVVAGLAAAVALAIGGWGLSRRRFGQDRLGLSDDQDDLENMSAGERKCLFAKRQQILTVLNNNQASLLQSRIQVRHLMSHSLLTVTKNTPADELLRTMEHNRIRHILVCGTDGHLAGVISDRDIKNRSGKTAADLMTPDPLTASPDDPVGHIISLMMHKHISCVPVAEDGHLCGIVTSTDMMMSLHCTLQILATLASKVTGAVQPQGAFCGDDTL